MEISNKSLAFLVVLAMSLSVISTLTLLNRITGLQKQEIVGKATQETGKVNLTLESQISIKLNNALIDFGTGYVNSSKGCNNATLIVDQNGYTNYNTCWTSAQYIIPQPKVPFLIENDGNQNVTLEIFGPNVSIFFKDLAAGTGNPYNVSWKARNNETEGGTPCPAAKLTTNYNSFNGDYQIVCDHDSFIHTPENADEIAVDIRVIIPDGLTNFGQYNGTIIFRAS